MPYPKPDDPDYCPMSDKPIVDLDPDKQWHRCPRCGRPICAMPNGRFFAHVLNIKRARRRDAIQESLIFHGLNQKERWTTTA